MVNKQIFILKKTDKKGFLSLSVQAEHGTNALVNVVDY